VEITPATAPLASPRSISRRSWARKPARTSSPRGQLGSGLGHGHVENLGDLPCLGEGDCLQSALRAWIKSFAATLVALASGLMKKKCRPAWGAPLVSTARREAR